MLINACTVVQYIFNRDNVNNCLRTFVHVKLLDRIYCFYQKLDRWDVVWFRGNIFPSFFHGKRGSRYDWYPPPPPQLVPMSSRGVFVRKAREVCIGTRKRVCFTRPIEFSPRARHGCAHSAGKRTAKLYTVKLKSAHVRAVTLRDAVALRGVCRCGGAGRTRRVNHHRLLSSAVSRVTVLRTDLKL